MAFHEAIVRPIPRPYETVMIILLIVSKKNNQELKEEFGFNLNSLGGYG